MRSPTANAPSATGIGQNQREFIAAEPGHHVGFTGTPADDGRCFDQRAAAAEVAMGVVDRLEAVEVDEQQRQRTAVSRCPLCFHDGAPG